MTETNVVIDIEGLGVMPADDTTKGSEQAEGEAMGVMFKYKGKWVEARIVYGEALKRCEEQ